MKFKLKKYFWDSFRFMDIFVDASVIPNVASVGLIVVISDDLLEPIIVTTFPNIHQSTYAEVFTARAALEIILKITNRSPIITLYSDCKNLCTLMERRTNLENRQFNNKRGRSLKYGDLYRHILVLIDSLVNIKKVKGHGKRTDEVGEIFSMVDRKCRKLLRTKNVTK